MQRTLKHRAAREGAQEGRAPSERVAHGARSTSPLSSNVPVTLEAVRRARQRCRIISRVSRSKTRTGNLDPCAPGSSASSRKPPSLAQAIQWQPQRRNPFWWTHPLGPRLPNARSISSPTPTSSHHVLLSPASPYRPALHLNCAFRHSALRPLLGSRLCRPSRYHAEVLGHLASLRRSRGRSGSSDRLPRSPQ